MSNVRRHNHAQLISGRARGSSVGRTVADNRQALSAGRRDVYDAPPEAYSRDDGWPIIPGNLTQAELTTLDEKIGELRLTGLSYMKISEAIGCSPEYVRNTCVRRGFKRENEK